MNWTSRFRGSALCCVSALLLAVATGCEKTNSAAEKKLAPPVKVETGSATEKEVTDFQDFTGRLEAVESVEVRARVSGYLTKIAFDERIELGAEVEAGAPLFEIDERPFKIALKNAEAQLAQADAKLKTSSAELARTEELFKKNAATQSDVDRDTGAKLLSAAQIEAGNAAVAKRLSIWNSRRSRPRSADASAGRFRPSAT